MEKQRKTRQDKARRQSKKVNQEVEKLDQTRKFTILLIKILQNKTKQKTKQNKIKQNRTRK